MSCARAMSWSVAGAFGGGDSGIEFVKRSARERGLGLVVRGAEMPTACRSRQILILASRTSVCESHHKP